MADLTPSDSISQAGSNGANSSYRTAPYPRQLYPKHHQPPSQFLQGQQYYQPYSAQVHGQGCPSYYNANPQPAVHCQSYAQSSSGGYRRSRRHSLAVRSSTIPGGLAARYVPTVSYSGSESTLVSQSTTQYSVPATHRRSSTSTYGGGAPYDVQRAQQLQVPHMTYPHPTSPYGTHSATTSPNTSPYSMETRALASYSHSSPPSPRPPSSYSTHSRLSSSPLHLAEQASPTPSAHPLPLALPPRTDQPVVGLNAPGQRVYINASQQYQQYQYYPQEAEQREKRKSSFLSSLVGILRRKSKSNGRRDSY